MPQRRSLHSNTIRRSRVGTAQLCRLVYGKGVGRQPRTLRGSVPHRPSLRTGSRWRSQRHATNAAPQPADNSRADAAESDDGTGTGSFRAVATKPSFQLLISPFTLPLLHLNPRQAAQATSPETRTVRRHRQPKFRRDNRTSDQLPPIHTNRIQTNRIQSKSGRDRGLLSALLP